jgi:hypothetical protein
MHEQHLTKLFVSNLLLPLIFLQSFPIHGGGEMRPVWDIIRVGNGNIGAGKI